MDMYDAFMIEEIPEEDRLNKLELVKKIPVNVKVISDIKILYSGYIPSNGNRPIGIILRLDCEVYKFNDIKDKFTLRQKNKKNYSILTNAPRLIFKLVQIAKENNDSLIGLKLNIERKITWSAITKKEIQTNYVVNVIKDFQ